MKEPRDADRKDLAALAGLWFEGWQDAHRGLLPADVAAHRTLAGFLARLEENLASIRTIGEIGHPQGFAFIKGDELYQFYVAEAARGTGIAIKLMADAEARLLAAGIGTGKLDCAIGNQRAARFYEKSGWRKVGNVTVDLDLSGKRFPLAVWRYEKAIA